MSFVFHDPDDCASYPHRVLIVPASVRTVRVANKLVRIQYPEQVFIICATCDHWVSRVYALCGCEARCHELEELVRTTCVTATQRLYWI